MRICGREKCQGNACPNWNICRAETIPPLGYAKIYLERGEPQQSISVE